VVGRVEHHQLGFEVVDERPRARDGLVDAGQDFRFRIVLADERGVDSPTAAAVMAFPSRA
jgi:hypothetical protein